MMESTEGIRFAPDDPEEEAFWKSMTAKDKAPYGGGWIAVVGASIVAHGRDLAAVDRDGRRASGRQPMIRYVAPDRGVPEGEFYEEMMPPDREPYWGEWIAVHGRRIVAHGKDEGEVHKEARRATSGKDSFMYYIDPPGAPSLFIGPWRLSAGSLTGPCPAAGGRAPFAPSAEPRGRPAAPARPDRGKRLAPPADGGMPARPRAARAAASPSPRCRLPGRRPGRLRPRPFPRPPAPRGSGTALCARPRACTAT